MLVSSALNPLSADRSTTTTRVIFGRKELRSLSKVLELTCSWQLGTCVPLSARCLTSTGTACSGDEEIIQLAIYRTTCLLIPPAKKNPPPSTNIHFLRLQQQPYVLINLWSCAGRAHDGLDGASDLSLYM